MLGILHTGPLLWPWASPAALLVRPRQMHSLSSAHAPIPGPSPGPGRLPQTQADALPELSTSPNTWAESGPWPPP